MSEAAGMPAPKRGRLLHKYVGLFAAVVSAALLGFGGIETWFLYRDQTDLLRRTQVAQADAAAASIGHFLREIESQIGWTTQIPWSAAPLEQHRLDAVRLLRLVPAITDLAYVDASGRERLRVSRLSIDVVGSMEDRSAEPAFVGAKEQRTYFGPVQFRRSTEPYMTLAVAGTRRESGVTVAEINLKFIWDVVTRIRVGESGRAYVVDRSGRLVAHPDIGLVLRNTDFSGLALVRTAVLSLSDGQIHESERTLFANGSVGDRVLAAFAPIVPTGWQVFVELPLEEALAPVFASLRRTGFLLLVGLGISVLAGLFLARRMAGPIETLRAGAVRIGAGELGHRVVVRTSDELEDLADGFNRMSRDLADARERNERIGRFRRFLTAQLADILESAGGEALLESHRREVSVVFCDLRGFTAFAEVTEPEEVMRVLGEYHRCLGALIAKYEGTLERFVGDGLMVLFNDPLPCPNPCERAVRMSLEMRAGIAALAGEWRRQGHDLGFGIGIAHGMTTLGRIGFEGRFDYSAIGNTPNLAARLCGEAKDGQILADDKVQAAVAGLVASEPLGELMLKGIRRPVPAFNMLTAN